MPKRREKAEIGVDNSKKFSLGVLEYEQSSKKRSVVRRPVGKLDWIENQVGWKQRKICVKSAQNSLTICQSVADEAECRHNLNNSKKQVQQVNN